MDVNTVTVEDFRKDKMLRRLVIQEIQLQNPAAFTALNARFLPDVRLLEQQILALKD